MTPPIRDVEPNYIVPRNYIELFYSRPCLMFHEMCYILTLHEKHNIENKWPKKIITAREARLVILPDWQIARFVG